MDNVSNGSQNLKTMVLISESYCRFYKENVKETAKNLLGYCIVFENEQIILFEKRKITLKELAREPFEKITSYLENTRLWLIETFMKIDQNLRVNKEIRAA